MREEGLLTGGTTPEDEVIESGLRPRKMDEFIGQGALKERLAILIEAAKGRGEA
ncbi:MAG: Holliday junction branch migration DNA helicase RuvB, partial [Acidimicrobiia bacterium]